MSPHSPSLAFCSLGCELHVKKRSLGALPPAWLTALVSVMIGSIPRSEIKPGMWLLALLELRISFQRSTKVSIRHVGKLLPEQHKPGPRLWLLTTQPDSWLPFCCVSQYNMARFTSSPLSFPRYSLLLFRLFHSMQG